MFVAAYTAHELDNVRGVSGRDVEHGDGRPTGIRHSPMALVLVTVVSKTADLCEVERKIDAAVVSSACVSHAVMGQGPGASPSTPQFLGSH